ncbi:glycoside hydrolase family 125 protein [Streptomyces sp. NPDC046805]|uniref:glycoside hydrolase family 125 protein n=1 Tax=Streptomyces sp. NPDC046805 TaxID=3155134 RepID=UPI0033F2DC93
MSGQTPPAAAALSAGLPKPLDLGNGLVAGSFGGDGSWLSLGAPHPVHGFVEMLAAPPFDEEQRGDPAAARRHREQLTQERFAFLRLDLPDEQMPERHAGLDGAGRPVWRRSGGGWTCSVTAWAPPGETALVQRYVIEAARDVRAVLRFGGRLDRSALAEITEVNPPLPLEVHSDVEVSPGELAVTAPVLATSARVAVHAAAGHWDPDADGAAQWEIAAGAGEPVEITVTVSLATPPWPGDGLRSTAPAPQITRADPPGTLERIAAGAVRYVLGCTALDVGEAERTILTDHRLLPLSWTRDAYYQALLLLCAAPDDHDVTDVVAGHLRWLWGRGRTPGAPWMRSHLPDGRPKDLAIQADQQLYPLLELADYRRVVGRWPLGPGDSGTDAYQWGKLIAEVWQGLPRDGHDGLLAGAENPADDPSELPFALSTQILYWHTASQLAPRSTELGLDALQLKQTAQHLRGAIARAFTCEGPFGPQWAYETDGNGRHRLYQDANDLPTAFAPDWGFCSPMDERWTATMRFAFSPHNPGHVAGRFGGLGSAHTPGTWTLGDAQELAVARTMTDTVRAKAVLERIGHVAGVDGLLPETYHADSGRWLARHWFAWPAAVFGILHFGITSAGHNGWRV